MKMCSGRSKTNYKGNKISISKHTISIRGLKNDLLIAVIADLHDRNPDSVISSVKNYNPDLILLPGDTFERRDSNIAGFDKSEMDRWMNSSKLWRVLCKSIKIFSDVTGITEKKSKEYSINYGRRLLAELTKVAPCVMSVGNHEWYFLEDDYSFLKTHNVSLLDNQNCKIDIHGQTINFGGLSTRYNFEWLKSFSNIGGIKILLCHHPEYYVRYIKGKKSDTFDLVVSGHAHGGQWRIFNQGMFAPGQGLFPRYTKGRYGKMIVSAGLSNTAFFPRFFNPMEVVLIRVQGKGNY